MSDSPGSRRLRVTIGITAHNEGQNLGRLIERLRRVNVDADLRIVVVASGCTDNTVEIAESAARDDARIHVIADPERRGKAVAINQLLEASRDTDIIVMESADTLPEPGAVEAMLARFRDPAVGMVGARPIPEDDESTFLGFAVQLLWRLHHAVASRSPKQGELVSWRNVVEALPADAVADEAYLEARITQAGYRLAYEPSAVVRNRGPATVSAFLTQRRRNHAIHRALAATRGYRPATRNHRLVARLALSEIAHRPGRVHWILGAALLELWASVLGLWDHRIARRDHAVWDVIDGSKALAATEFDRLPKVVVLVVTYNGGSDVLECLASVKRLRYSAMDVLVVDNGSTDNSGQLVRQKYPDVRVLRIDTNHGLAKGFNAGVVEALRTSCDFILSLSDDVVVARDFLQEAITTALGEPRAASVTGPVFYYDEPERIWYAGAEIAWWLGKTYHRGRRVIWGPAFREPRKVGYSSGAAALYNAAALRAVGLWDEQYFLVFEDCDWCIRATRAGWYHRYVPGPKAWHKVSASFGGEKSPLYLYFLFRNNIRLMRRHAQPWHWPTFVLFFAAESLARYSLSALFGSSRLLHERAIWVGVIDALRGRYGRGSSASILHGTRGGLTPEQPRELEAREQPA